VQVDLFRAVTDPSVLVRSLWLAWLMTWWAAAFWSTRAVGRPGAIASAAFVAVTIAGFAFTWWARLTIGTLWSSGVTRKADHRIVDNGPYGLVRHPIYTGLILAAFATAFVPLTPLTLAGAALITVGFYLKARVEEGFLRAELGPEAYDAYASRVPMLVPRVQ
jgi:protein-S-isoprenylcysteine O-methyltransferase Ste14